MGFNDIFMNVWLSSTWELQTDLSLKEDASTAKPLYPFMETFSRKKIS